jgi:hypothetical protein
LDENALIKLDPVLSADATYDGIAKDVTAGDTIAYGEVVYYKADDSEWYKTDADASATAGPVMLGIAVTAGTDGETMTVLKYGEIREDDWNWATIGAPLYLSTDAGALTLTAPSGASDVVRIVGYVIDANTIFFAPDSTYVIV